MFFFKRNFYTQKLYAHQRTGPHNKDVLSVLVGNLLGDGHAEKRNNSTRFQIHVSSRNAEYVFWLHKFFAKKGYCSPRKPVVKKQIKKNNTIYFSIKFKTFSFSSFNFVYDSFYVSLNKQKKFIPTNIKPFLTEQALAIWVMDNGEKSGSGMKICTEKFCFSENLLLQKTLSEKFCVKPIIQHNYSVSLPCIPSKGYGNTVLYFKKSDLLSLSLVIKSHMLPCMYYKLNLGKGYEEPTLQS